MYNRRVVGEGSKIRQKSKAKQDRGKDIGEECNVPIGNKALLDSGAIELFADRKYAV